MSNKLDRSGGLSFEEKSVWLQLLATALVMGAYLVVAGRMMASGVADLRAYAAVFGVSVALLVAVLVAGFIAVALATRQDGRDERDRLIAWRAESQSGWLAGAGILTGITCMVLDLPNVWTAHILLSSLLVAELLKFGLQLYYYRRGVL